MKALIVVESMFGNTARIAARIADGIAESMSVDVVDVTAAPPVPGDDVALLVVGGPTHAFGMSRPMTREDAAKQGAGAPTAIGVREWLDTLALDSAELAAASFDTRVHKPFLPGSAARAIARRLRGKGATIVAAPISFFVTETPGPLTEGEEARAAAFGRQLVTDMRRRGFWRELA